MKSATDILSKSLLILVPIVVAVFVVAVFFYMRQPPDFSSLDSTIETLSAKPVIQVAYSKRAGPHSYEDNGAKGFEPDLLREMIRRWYKIDISDVDQKIKFTPILASERIPKAESGDYNIVIGATSRTEERCSLSDEKYKVICTETIYMQDKIHIMVLDSGVDFSDTESFCGYFSKSKVSVVNGTTAKDKINKIISSLFSKCRDITSFTFAVPESMNAMSKEEAIYQVSRRSKKSNGNSKGYFTDGTILRFLKQQYENNKQLHPMKVVGFDINNELKPEIYSFLINENNPGLRELLDYTLTEMLCDGTIEEMFSKYQKYTFDDSMTKDSDDFNIETIKALYCNNNGKPLSAPPDKVHDLITK